MTDNINTAELNTDIFNDEMSANISKPLTAREIFEKIVELQKQLTENSYNSLHRLDDSISSICEDENEERFEQISEVCSVFKMRETTLIKMLELYEKMYNDLNPGSTNQTNKAIVDSLIKGISTPGANSGSTEYLCKLLERML